MIAPGLFFLAPVWVVGGRLPVLGFFKSRSKEAKICITTHPGRAADQGSPPPSRPVSGGLLRTAGHQPQSPRPDRNRAPLPLHRYADRHQPGKRLHTGLFSARQAVKAAMIHSLLPARQSPSPAQSSTIKVQRDARIRRLHLDNRTSLLQVHIHAAERHVKRRDDGSPERSTAFTDPAAAGRARRCRMVIMILPHGPSMTGGELLRYALVLGTAVCAGL